MLFPPCHWEVVLIFKPKSRGEKKIGPFPFHLIMNSSLWDGAIVGEGSRAFVIYRPQLQVGELGLRKIHLTNLLERVWL